MSNLRVIAIDWSGRKGRDQRKAIWQAEAIDGEVVALHEGRTRDEVVADLIEGARRERLVVGFDFAFSLPAWYLTARQYGSAADLWAAVAEQRPAMSQLGLAGWLERPEPPFWTTVFGFRVDDIEAASAELEAAGFEILCDIHRIPELHYAFFHFRGPDGRVYGINEQKEPVGA